MSIQPADLPRKVRQLSADVEEIYEKLDRIEETQTQHGTRLDRIELRLDGIDGKLGGVDGRLEGVDGRLGGVDGRLDGIDGKLGEVLAILKAG